MLTAQSFEQNSVNPATGHYSLVCAMQSGRIARKLDRNPATPDNTGRMSPMSQAGYANPLSGPLNVPDSPATP
ncbi:MAG: hypothetical protein LBT11_03730, partial [Treponema sp.]|nr:hypothetical protein [Treponema sp.]